MRSLIRDLMIQSNSLFFGDVFDTARHDRLRCYEKKNEYTLELDIPGATKDMITVVVDNNRNLIIKGKRHSGDTDREFKRVLLLPDDTDESNIKAKLENGILYLLIPKINEQLIKGTEIKIN